MDTEAKHGLPKVVALADKLARLVLDQIEKDGCGNLGNIRNALVGPLAQDEMDRQDERMRQAEKHAKARDQWEAAGRFEKGVKKLAEGLTENMLSDSGVADALRYGIGARLDRSRKVFEGVDLAKPLEGVKGPVGPIGPSAPADAIPTIDVALWGQCSDGHRFNVAATRPLLKALGDAIASGQAQRVSISDGTYVLPDGEVLTEREMFMRSGTDGRRS